MDYVEAGMLANVNPNPMGYFGGQSIAHRTTSIPFYGWDYQLCAVLIMHEVFGNPICFRIILLPMSDGLIVNMAGVIGAADLTFVSHQRFKISCAKNFQLLGSSTFV